MDTVNVTGVRDERLRPVRDALMQELSTPQGDWGW